MKSAGFIHLHNHTEYSILDGMLRVSDGDNHPSEFLRHLAAKNIPAMAITDHGNMYGAAEFYFMASELGIRPIIGCEVYVARDSRTDRNPQKETGHMTILARDYEGYQNLMEIVSRAFLEGYYHAPRIDTELLAQHAKGLIALSGCLKSHIARRCADGRLEEAEKLACGYRDILGKENFYLELMDHGIAEEQAAMKGLLEISKRTGIPVVATNDCHYPKKEDWEAHDAHMCISTGSLLDDARRMRMSTHEFYFKSPEEMIQLFSHSPQALASTMEIAERCHVKLPTDKLYLPHFEVPAAFAGMDQDRYLEHLCLEGLKAKLGGKIPPEYAERLKFELSVIARMGFASYFLIVTDFINHARSQNIPVGPGRGSGAGSLVAFSLDITRIDPIVNGLLFERFLNPDRKSMPDLDIDFSDEGRPRVIEYVRKKYGEANVAQIITFGTIRAKSAVKDVGRVMGVPLPEVEKIAKLIPSAPDSTVYKALRTVPELQEAAKDPATKKLLELAQKLEGLRRHTSVHAAGMVITREAVTKYVPLANRNTKDVVTTQYAGEILPRLGLLKVDFLGLRTLTVIENVSAMVRKRHKPDFDIYKASLDDKKTFDFLLSARSTGIFQLESAGMRDLIRSLKPTVFSDISALVALFRPGPMQSGMLDLFVERKNGRQKIVCDHPMLEPILRDTYGTIVYQEQVMEIAKKLGNFSPGDADELRKAMGKKNPEVMEKARGRFAEGCRANGIQARLATKIFDQMAQFAGYGFNKSHSVAYALVAYQTAYLKANYPLEFMTALLTSEIGHSAIGSEDKENKLVTYLDEARDMGLDILPPDVQRSFRDFAIEKDRSDKECIRFALSAIKNVGEEVVNSIVAAREEGGDFKSLKDFCCRIDTRQANKKVLESLAKAGAFDSVYPGLKPEESRAIALSELETEAEAAGMAREERERGQGMLFNETQRGTHASGRKKKDFVPLSEHVLLKDEREVLGFYLSGHPLGRLQRQLEMIATHPIDKIPAGSGSMVRLAGMITQVKKMVSKKSNQPWARVEFEDLTGSVAVLAFPKTYNKFSEKLAPNRMTVVVGKVSVRPDTNPPQTEIFAEEVLGLYDALSRWGRNLILSISRTAAHEELQLAGLKTVLAKHPGCTPVYFRLETASHGPAIVETGERVAVSEALITDIEKTLGDRTWLIESASL
ncbi:MAG: DNA polymerase III subunit alpha [bacterium]